MIAIDTNVLVRLITGDDRKQQKAAMAYLGAHCSADEPAWVSPVVAAETIWVLQRAYGYSREQIASAVERLLDTVELLFEQSECVRAALAGYRSGAGFADALLAESTIARGCRTIVTFDADAAKRMNAFTLL